MKKLLALLLCLLMVFSLFAACEKDDDYDDEDDEEIEDDRDDEDSEGKEKTLFDTWEINGIQYTFAKDGTFYVNGVESGKYTIEDNIISIPMTEDGEEVYHDFHYVLDGDALTFTEVGTDEVVELTRVLAVERPLPGQEESEKPNSNPQIQYPDAPEDEIEVTMDDDVSIPWEEDEVMTPDVWEDAYNPLVGTWDSNGYTVIFYADGTYEDSNDDWGEYVISGYTVTILSAVYADSNPNGITYNYSLVDGELGLENEGIAFYFTKVE